MALHLFSHVTGEIPPHDCVDVRSTDEIGERVAKSVDGEALVDPGDLATFLECHVEAVRGARRHDRRRSAGGVGGAYQLDRIVAAKTGTATYVGFIDSAFSPELAWLFFQLTTCTSRPCTYQSCGEETAPY